MTDLSKNKSTTAYNTYTIAGPIATTTTEPTEVTTPTTPTTPPCDTSTSTTTIELNRQSDLMSRVYDKVSSLAQYLNKPVSVTFPADVSAQSPDVPSATPKPYNELMLEFR